jgi:ERCC4-type nuclease
LTIVADVREASAGVGAALVALDVRVVWRRLHVADYALNGNVGVERKTVSDLHGSIIGGRLWRQVTAMKTAFARSYLLVEGVNLDGGPLSADAVRGALLALTDQEVVVLRSLSKRDSAVWLRRLACRAERTHYRPRRRAYVRAPTQVALLSSVPGISPTVATALLARFGSLVAIASVDEARLQEVPGIGPTRARTVRRLLTERFPAKRESAERG